MRQVADHLRQQTVTLGSEQDVDAFARSAFNRYYYASYLVARGLDREIRAAAQSPGHKALPEIIVGTLRERILRELRSAAKSRLLPYGRVESCKAKVCSATQSLSELLISGYGLRVIADYEPEQIAHRNGKTVLLSGTTLDAAARWPERADRFCGEILSVWKELGH